ncbi:hypothetical protein [uncultured Chryseobacterium sp.]|uniref:hypothetical protein n=1 Tax=uncultured Chryseobacterium sp. TaxID=259322 RepID=UPI0025CF343C|nr:hypothetical protein [uncultured Chryseobacterium sp.]
MIRKIRYSDIDFEKYSACLESSVQKNWYARREVLDELSGNWHILVLNDYKAVMPINIKKKYGLNFVHMPLFCQQLGIFSLFDDPQINDEFLFFLKNNYRIFLYCFNDTNSFTTQIENRKNYIIPVSDYLLLKRKKYFKGRKSTVKWSQHLIYRELQPDKMIEQFIAENSKGISKYRDLEKFKNYFDFLYKNNSLKLCCAYLNDQLISLAILISEDKQFSLLSLINHKKFTDENGPSFLIDQILKNHIHEKTLNFMGGNIRGIEVFFKSFGGELKSFPIVENKFMKKFS